MPVSNVPSEPQGTLQELRQFELDPSQHGSCSPRTPTNLGCSYFRKCRFHRWKNQEEGLRGPLGITVRIKLRQQEGGHADNRDMNCFMYYQSGLDERQKRQDETGEDIRIVAVEGGTGADDVLGHRASRSVGDPKNPRDVRVETFVHKAKVVPFKRLGESNEAESFNADVTAQILEERASAPVVDPPKKVKRGEA